VQEAHRSVTPGEQQQEGCSDTGTTGVLCFVGWVVDHAMFMACWRGLLLWHWNVYTGNGHEGSLAAKPMLSAA
jgi:hypothetical protein